MKTQIVLFLVAVFSLSSIAQQNEGKVYEQDVDKKYELKINAFNLIAFASIDVSYEKLINANSSYGLSVFYNFSGNNDNVNFPKKFSATPYYRWFFSETTFARGFFVEGFGMLNTYEDEIYSFTNGSSQYLVDTISETSFALGISVGGKFVTKYGFTAEVLLGVGRNLIGESDAESFLDNDVVGRFGISLGYRF
ncbi:MAG: hypothetical protein ACJA1B_001798 [Polaribacter sp.]|jgi:hypothetical protein